MVSKHAMTAGGKSRSYLAARSQSTSIPCTALLTAVVHSPQISPAHRGQQINASDAPNPLDGGEEENGDGCTSGLLHEVHDRDGENIYAGREARRKSNSSIPQSDTPPPDNLAGLAPAVSLLKSPFGFYVRLVCSSSA